MDIAFDKKAKARERSRKWRESRIEKGLCYKHNIRPRCIPHCYVCRPNEPLCSPTIGEEIKVCTRCDQCGNIYHVGGHYNYHPPRIRKNHGTIEGPNGSLINYDKRRARDSKVLTLCGQCRAEALTAGCYEENIAEWRYRNPSRWGGLCDPHEAQARRLTKDEHIGEQGRGITLRWSKANMNEMPAEYDECGCKVLMPRSTAINYRNEPPTSGRCIDHQPVPPHKKAEDKHIGEEGRGVWLRFSQEDEQGRILIEYEVCGPTCSRYAPRGTGLSYLHSVEVQGRRVRGMCAEHVKDPAALLERQKAELANVNGQKNGGAEKKPHGGARNVKWTPEQEETFLSRYEETLPKIRKKDPSIPSDVLAKLLLPGNQPSDVARDYVAQLMNVESNDYLRALITRARKRRRQNALHSSSNLNVA